MKSRRYLQGLTVRRDEHMQITNPLQMNDREIEKFTNPDLK